MEFILKHKKKDSWSGVYKYKNCFDYIGPMLTRSGNAHTGLTKEDESRLEKALNFQEGQLAAYSQFWKTFAVKITNNELILNTDRPWDELQYLFLKNHKLVANGIADIKAGAHYVLINKDADAKEANRASRRRREALREFDKLSLEDMRKALRIYGYKADTMSAELVESKLFELIEKDPEAFFMKWVNNKNKDTEFIIHAGIAKNILRKSRNVYYYGTDIIGNSIDDAIAYINDKNNQDLKMAIMNELESK